MQAVTFQAPGEVRLEERPEPELVERDDAVVRVEATGVCGSDLHIYHGRVQIEPGFTLGHEFVGTVVAAGEAVTEVSEGDRVLGCFCSACGNCFFCRRGDYHKCDGSRTFGHGATLGGLEGTQAELALVPRANLTLRPGRATRALTVSGWIGIEPRISTVTRPIRAPSRGSHSSSARASSADGGPACWAFGSQGPRVSSVGVAKSPSSE